MLMIALKVARTVVFVGIGIYMARRLKGIEGEIKKTNARMGA